MTLAKIALAAAAFALATGASAAPKGPDPVAAKGEARLAKMLEGRVAGKPVSCISAQIGSNLQVIDRTAIVYNAGSTIYVARADDPGSLNSDDILVIKRFGSQICRQDIIHTIDRTSGFMTGVVFLRDFTPYTRR
jgi:hypothetical protein